MTGTCLCGGVRFAVDEPFLVTGACHCTNCKKISGGAGTVSGRAPTSAIRLLAGAEHVRTFQPAEGTAKSFCAVCGSNLFGGGWPASEWTS
ncbi:MAG: GFA family protein, partial [Thermoleophilia bacterium]|nr:GFA family protein [Thermoleophilia bacterium]